MMHQDQNIFIMQHLLQEFILYKLMAFPLLNFHLRYEEQGSCFVGELIVSGKDVLCNTSYDSSSELGKQFMIDKLGYNAEWIEWRESDQEDEEPNMYI